MVKTKCEKCGSQQLKVMQAGKRTGLYCDECGALVQWLTRKIDIRDAYSLLIRKEDIVGRAVKKVIMYGGITTLRCEKCDCLLYSSSVTSPQGQYDLVDANYCPKCGAEFVEKQKKFSKK